MATASLRKLFLKNAVANVIGGIGTTLFNLLLPALVVRHLGKLEFSLWSLSLQILIYMQLFGFGLQTAMTKFIAHGNEISDLNDQRKTIKSGLVLVSFFSFFAVLAVGLLAIVYPLFFDNIPADMVGEFRTCITILGMSAALQLFALVPSGMFIGLHRNIVPVGGLLLTRMSSLFFIWLVLSNDGTLVEISVVLAFCGAMILPISYCYAKKWGGELVQNLGKIDWIRCKELFYYCSSLAVWSVAMLFVNGIDLVIVGHYDFEKVASYSLAITAISILVGVMQAVLGPLVAIGSASFAKADKQVRLPKLLTISSASCAIFLIFVIVLFFLFGKVLLALWVDVSYVDDVYTLLSIMLFAHAVRSLLSPYSLLLLSIAEHKKAFMPAIIEGVVNLSFSLMLAPSYGVIGVIYGTLIGAIAGVISALIFVVDRTKILSISRLHFFNRVILFPVVTLGMLFWLFHI